MEIAGAELLHSLGRKAGLHDDVHGRGVSLLLGAPCAIPEVVRGVLLKLVLQSESAVECVLHPSILRDEREKGGANKITRQDEEKHG